MNEVKLISVTPDAEQHMAYCARVSNPNNQDNPNYANTNVLALTAGVSKEEIEKCKEFGFDDYLGKPFRFEELMKKMEKILK